MRLAAESIAGRNGSGIRGEAGAGQRVAHTGKDRTHGDEAGEKEHTTQHKPDGQA
jgi:hypothetical protein